MSEPQITNLARRLAEQNNVDWRRLSGSGPDGSVLERDVLDYLARVMAGEEAVDPTPEPLPEGMDSWTEVGVDSVGNYSRSSAAAPELGSLGVATHAAGAEDDVLGSAADLDEDLFLLDDDDDLAVPAAEGTNAHEPSWGADAHDSPASYAAPLEAPAEPAGHGTVIPADDDDLLLVSDEEDELAPRSAPPVGGHDEPYRSPDPAEQAFTAAETFAGEHPYSNEDAHDAFAAANAPVAADASVAADAPVASDAPSDAPSDAAASYWEPAASHDHTPAEAGSTTPFDPTADTRDVWQSGAPTSHEAVSTGSAPSSEQAHDPTPSTGWHTEPHHSGSEWGAGDLRLGASDPEGEFAATPDLWVTGESPAADVTETTDAEQPDPWADSGAAADAADLWAEPSSAGEQPAEVVETLDDRFAWGGPETFDAADVPTDEFAPNADVVEPLDDHLASEADDAEEQEFLDDLATLDGVIADEVQADPVMAAPAPVSALAPAATADLPLLRAPQLLRRNIDVSALAAAQLAAGLELGHQEPLAPAPFLLRAVAKAVRSEGFGGGQLALAEFDAGLRLRRVDDAATRPFVELVSELAEPGVEEDEVGLVAVDLSGLELDEAFLDVNVPAVTLGRILYDSEVGGYRSTLALTGDLPVAQGAKLLAAIAELLSAPIRLLV